MGNEEKLDHVVKSYDCLYSVQYILQLVVVTQASLTTP